MAELIASSVNAANSADFTLTTGVTATLNLKGPADTWVGPQSIAYVQIKSADGRYYTIGALTVQNPASVLSAVGTFRVAKIAAPDAFGVDKN